MIYKIFWTVSAENDLNEILDRMIENDDKNNARRIYEKVKQRAELLAISPEQGRNLAEFKIFENKKYREIIIKPWRMIYKIGEKEVTILLFIDGRRNIEDILFERLVKAEGS